MVGYILIIMCSQDRLKKVLAQLEECLAEEKAFQEVCPELSREDRLLELEATVQEIRNEIEETASRSRGT